MGLETYHITVGCVSAVLLVGVIIDQVYQRVSHKWTNEPPLFPYRIPIIGHGLAFLSDSASLFRSVTQQFPNCQPYSLILFGKRVYVITNIKDVTLVFRKGKALPFVPLVESLSGLAWDISPDGMRRLSEVDETGDSVFRNASAFYHDALKPGPKLDSLTMSFLHYLQKGLDEFESTKSSQYISLYSWSGSMLGAASTDSMMGPALLRDNPDLLHYVELVHHGFFLFVNKVPKIFARKYYRARDRVNAAFTNYFADERNKEGSSPMMWDRADQLREKGMTTRDIAAYSYSAYAALLVNANPAAYHLLFRIFTNKDSLARLRTEIAPAFKTGNAITTSEQVHHLLNGCPLLRAFFDETLRLDTTSASNRRVVEDTTVGGYTLKTGNNVICPTYTQHHSPEYFGRDPDEFKPERFLQPFLANGTCADPKKVRAFGGGVSLCSGRFFASNEVMCYGAIVLWRFDIKFKGGGMVSIVPRKYD